ncbi:MAG TPA: DUF4129 domain-containing protein [Anaerolineae bacterium]
MKTLQSNSNKTTASEIDAEYLSFVTNTWSRTVVQPFLIALLITSLFTGILVLLDVLMPGRQWLSLSFFCLFVTLEGIYTTLWLNHPNRRLLNRLAYRTAELVVIIILLRLYTWVVTGNWPDLLPLQVFLRSPFVLFAGLLFLAGSVIVALAWQRALEVSEVFALLSIDRAEADYYSLPPHEREWSARPLRVDRGPLVTTFFQQWIWGGIILAVCTALSTLDFRVMVAADNPFAIVRLGLPPAMLAALMIYFLSGFLLLSQARLAAMNARWLNDGVVKSRRVERSWHRSSLWLLLVIALGAAFLPLGSTLAISRILQMLVAAMTLAFYLLSFLFFSLLAFFFASVPASAPEARPDALENLVVPTPVPRATPAAPNETAEIVVSSLFWTLIIVVTVMAIGFYLRERGYRLNAESLRRAWSAVSDWLRRIWRGASTQARDIQHAVRTRLRPQTKEEDQSKKSPWRFIRVNSLSPREQIRYFYLSTVRRAADQGVARQQSETPLEYAEDLKENWPEVEVDVEELTEAFLRARYSAQPIDREDVNPVKRRWKQLRARLRQRRRQEDDGM